MMDLLGINRKIGDIQRLREIVNVLIKHGFGHFIQRLNLDEILPFGEKFFKRIKTEPVEFPGYDRIRQVLEELGPTFIKFGQILSLRTDVVPPDLALELEKLQDRVRPVEWETLRESLDGQLPEAFGQRVQEVDPEPLASASLAQVHRATLEDGETCILKFRRPGITDKVKRDVDLMKFIADLMERYLEDARKFNPVGLVDEFGTTIRNELNFVNEAINVHRFRSNFENVDDVLIPRVYWELTGERVLALEWVEGEPISTYFDSEADPPVPRESLARRGSEIVFKQIFEDGFFHGDPHPGNILITPRGRIAFVDFGIVGRFDQELMDELAHILVAVDSRDSHAVMKVLTRLGILQPQNESVEVRRHLLRLIDKYYEIPFRQLRSRDIFEDLNRFMTRFEIRFPPDFYMLLKAVLTVESLGERLDPGFEIARTAKPYLTRLVNRQRGYERLRTMAPNIAFDLIRFLRDLPSDIYDLFRQLKSGQMHFEFEHRGLEALIAGLHRSSNRLSLAMILSALIIGSSMLIASGVGPRIWGYPLLGLTGFVIAGLFGVALALSIFRSGRF